MRVRWKDFELPLRVTLDDESSTKEYTKFHAEPFERGFGTTIGNALRRVLYSSIEGTAVTALKIKGVTHEFSSIEGVVEDVTEVVLNLKQLSVHLEDAGSKSLTLDVSKKGPITAGDLTMDSGVEILNPDFVLFTLTENRPVHMVITVERGRRYVTAEDHAKDIQETGVIPIDSSYSPVKRVRYSVDNTRVGKRTNYDRLNLEIWTNGSITPEEALVEASKTLRKHLNPFVQYFDLGRELQINEKKEEELRRKEKDLDDLRQKLSMSISELDLSVRSANCLSTERIETIGELVSRSEPDLLKVRNFGKTSLREVRKKLSEINLGLGLDLEAIFGPSNAAH